MLVNINDCFTEKDWKELQNRVRIMYGEGNTYSYAQLMSDAIEQECDDRVNYCLAEYYVEELSRFSDLPELDKEVFQLLYEAEIVTDVDDYTLQFRVGMSDYMSAFDFVQERLAELGSSAVAEMLCDWYNGYAPKVYIWDGKQFFFFSDSQTVVTCIRN